MTEVTTSKATQPRRLQEILDALYARTPSRLQLPRRGMSVPATFSELEKAAVFLVKGYSTLASRVTLGEAGSNLQETRVQEWIFDTTLSATEEAICSTSPGGPMDDEVITVEVWISVSPEQVAQALATALGDDPDISGFSLGGLDVSPDGSIRAAAEVTVESGMAAMEWQRFLVSGELSARVELTVQSHLSRG